jgi:hypothetical protein
MAHSTARGLLYTTPPTEETAQATDESSIGEQPSTTDEPGRTRHGRAAADD